MAQTEELSLITVALAQAMASLEVAATLTGTVETVETATAVKKGVATTDPRTDALTTGKGNLALSVQRVPRANRLERLPCPSLPRATALLMKTPAMAISSMKYGECVSYPHSHRS